ncbi:MAG: cob(I)yrinic acid a,c-diamide adenosyltransferase [candidate division WOR-3 bacterium]
MILTGRYCPKELYEYADLVSEINEIKHPFQKGYFGRKGIDY